MVEAARAKRGLVTRMADALGCDPSTVDRYAKQYSTVALAIQEQRRRLVDTSEDKLSDAVDAGEQWAVQMVLRTLGKDRGYGESTALDITGVMKVEWPD